jgi:eukaryotic-like serine/threonine-protein kinase
MPVPTTTDDFLQVVRRSELVPPYRLDPFLRDTPECATASTPRELSDLLQASGLITRFQAEQFLQGKWRGFTIGKYKVLERLGSGGMGTVYLCEHMAVCRKVAVKVLPTSQSHNPSALGRFYREARAAGVLDHANLVKAHDIDQDGDLHFLVMDYVDGSSLQDLVTRFGPLSPTRACHYVRQAAAGLAAAHDAGLIHRDVKPANIMLERNGAVRVLDLGLARFKDDIDLLTLKYDDKNVLGTADYVAPEQALNSHEVDTRCDIYSLGATFYFMLTGQPPFPGGKVAQKLIWHQVRQPTPVRQIRPEIPETMQAVLQRMMAKDLKERYQTLREVLDGLAPLAPERLAPPSEEEMPRLSPAVAMPATPSVTVPRPLTPQLPRRSSQAAVLRPSPQGAALRPAGSPSSGRVSTLDRPPSAADLATPRHLASPQTATDTEQPRPAVSPSRALEGPAKPSKLAQPGGVDLSVVVIALLGGLIGIGLTVWFVLR